jgi:transmembrane sensor
MPDRTPANIDADLQHAPTGNVARFRWMFALAAIIPVAGSSILLDPMPVKYYETASGKYWPVTCHNSVVSLEPQSLAAIQCTRYALRVRLIRGAALFRVQHDSSRSVVVLAGNAQVRDLGTVFSVHRYTDRTTVTVLEGAVQLSRPVVGGPWASAADPVEEVAVWARERASVEDDMTSSHIASPERFTP